MQFLFFFLHYCLDLKGNFLSTVHYVRPEDPHLFVPKEGKDCCKAILHIRLLNFFFPCSILCMKYKLRLMWQNTRDRTFPWQRYLNSISCVSVLGDRDPISLMPKFSKSHQCHQCTSSEAHFTFKWLKVSSPAFQPNSWFATEQIHCCKCLNSFNPKCLQKLVMVILLTEPLQS